MPDSPLQGHTALVTGATAGIGRSIAELLAAQGATVLVHGRSPDRGRDTVTAIHAEPLPAVVGIAMIGRAGPVCTAGALYEHISPPFADRMARAFAVSIGLPPPNPITESALCSATILSPSSRESVVGSGTVPENNAGFLPGGPEERHDPVGCTGIRQIRVGDENRSVQTQLVDNRADLVDRSGPDPGETGK